MISADLANRLGPVWFGDQIFPDEHATTQPAYVAALTDNLIRHRHMTPGATQAGEDIPSDEPLEALMIRNGRTSKPRPANGPQGSPSPSPRQSLPSRRGEPAPPEPAQWWV